MSSLLPPKPTAAAADVGDKSLDSVRRYEVLYYKRTNKVHKSKGVSKLDGILTVSAPPHCKVTLSAAANGETSDEEEEEEPRGKKKWKKPAKTQGPWSGINRDISKNAFGDIGLQVDDIIVLPQLECQIVSVLSKQNMKNSKASISNRPSNNTVITLKKKPVIPLQSRNNLSSKATGPRRQFPIKGPKTYPPQKPSSSTTISSWQARRVPPRQPKQAIIKENSPQDCDSETENRPPKRPLVRDPNNKITNFNNKLPKRKRLTVTQPPKKNHVAAPLQASSSSSFPGAIGNVIVPHSIRAVLRPHQREGVAFLWNCLTGASPSLQQAARDAGISSALRGCILADEMGLGKTLMTISTIFALHRRKKNHRFIVVCPSSLVCNWSKEFDKWIGKASQPKRVLIRKGGEEGVAALRAFVPVKPHQSEVLIISYDLFRMTSYILTQAKQIGLLCVDEGHRLKNTAGSLTLTALNALHCESRLLITGTPIQNNLGEYHNVASFVCPGLLGDLKSFKRTFERPISAANHKKASWEQKTKGQAQSRALENITKTFMLRRLQKDVLKSLLPPRQELLLFCRPSSQQCDIYKTLTSHHSADANIGGASAEALTVLTNLRKLCSHPSLLDKNKVLNSTQLDNMDSVSLSGKLVVLQGLLKAVRACNPDDKVVIVSNFTSALSVIEALVLRKNNWSSKRLDGSTEQSERQNLVDSFNRGSPEQSFAFLLSSKAGGCGLNLIGANRLIMFDSDWNPATDMQAMARIYRQGQVKPCFIYRFFTSGTVEEVIYQRQYQKGNLATLTVDGTAGVMMSAQSKGFSKEELRDCFTLKKGCACDTKQKVGNRWPTYDGVSGLENQCCFDEPLLAVAGEESETLAFVHVVTEGEERTEIEETKNPASESESAKWSSDEECEFE